MVDLARLLRPRSIAVFGGAWAREVIRQLAKMKFDGAVWPVHPERTRIEGLPVFASVEALPEAPDAAFIGVNRRETLQVVTALRARGAGGAVCFASGFAEIGAEGAALQASLAAAAGAMPLLGPNCYGFINAFDRALIWPDLHGCAPVERGVAILAQSSNIAINLTMARRTLPIGYVLCLGNQAVVGLPGAIEAMARDPRVSVIALHIESISDPVGFARAVALARAQGQHVIALRAGRSEGSRAMVMSHSASLAGASAVAEAFLRRLGVAEVATIPELLETAKLLHVLGPLGGGGLASMSCSGGEASLIADAAERAGVPMPAFPDERVAAIRATVNPLVTVSNPFDYHTFDWGKREPLFATFREVMASGQAVTALALDFPRAELGAAEGWDIALDAFAAAARAAGAKALVVATVPECLPDDRAARLAADGLAPMQGLAEAMAAVRAAVQLGHAQDDPPFAPLPPAPSRDGEPANLDEAEAKARLANFGVEVPEGCLCATRAQALAAVARLAPAAMKAVGAHIAHKTELGAVRLAVADSDAAGRAYDELARLSPRILVERMVEAPVAELIVGAARDPALGLHLVIGAGGVLAELIGDRRILVLPARETEIRAAVESLRIDRLLRGWRGKPSGDREALIGAIATIAAFVVAHADRLEELDINPLIVTPDRAVAVDAFLRWRGPQS